MFKLDFGECTYESKWIDYEVGGEMQEGVQLKIRMYPNSQDEIHYNPDGIIIAGSGQCKKFKYCLEDWRGVVDAKDKELPCTNDAKQKLFDFDFLAPGLVAFVFSKDAEMKREKAVLEKNSVTGVSGTSQKTE